MRLSGSHACIPKTGKLLLRPMQFCQLAKKHMSCIAGHQQGLQVAISGRADGKRLTSIIAGSCYQHDEDYMGPQGNKHWRGCLMLHNVNQGEFDCVPVPLVYLERKYGS